ncbi:hypothetical protein EsDP_00001488 [Epichloe bromicola]|uniref:Uncharacterized protein n=1 Tax=Epichloe bromicola TaxID=79588 RepID=A0ABQ0CIH3_9HYPO
MAAAPAVRSSLEALSPVADLALGEGARNGVHIKKHLAAHLSASRPSSSSSLFEAETDMSTPLLPPGDIDWGSDDDKSPPLEYPNSSPMHLITSTTARIQIFLTKYISENRVWIQYEQNVSRIPWRELNEYAAEKKKSVAELLHMYRPSLPTDEISRDDIAKAARFLHGKGLGAYVSSLDGWFGIGKMDFLDLNVCGAMFRDTLDTEAIKKAVEWGWIDIGEVLRNARERARRLILQTDAACPVQDAFLGTIQNVVEPRFAVTTHEGVDYSRDGVYITPRCNRTVWSGILENIDEVAPVSLIQDQQSRVPANVQRVNKDRNGKQKSATKAQIEEIRISLARQVPTLLPRHVPGSMVMTAEERARATETATATATAKPMSTSGRAHKTPLPRTPTQSVRRQKSQDLRKVATARVFQDFMSPWGAKRELDGLLGSSENCEVSAAAGNGLLNGYNKRRQSQPNQDVNGTSGGRGEQVAAREEDILDSTKDAGPSCTGLSGIGQVSAAQACSAELRKALDNNYSEYLRADDRATPPRRKRSISQIEIPEAEDDADYVPAKSSATKRKAAVHLQNKVVKKKKGGLAEGECIDRRISATNHPKIPSRTTTSRTRTKPSRVVANKSKASKRPRAGGSEDDDSDVHLRRQNKRRCPRKDDASRDGDAVDDHDDEPPESEPVKMKKNTEPIFGIPRNQELFGPLERAEEVEYAWSADAAEFAMVSARAKYALKADGISEKKCAQVEDTGQVDEALYTLMRLQNRFGVVEATQRSRAAQDAGKARFAGCADWALYAVDAEVADYVLGSVQETNEAGEDGVNDERGPQEMRI